MIEVMFEIIGIAALIILALLWFPYISKTTKKGAPFVAMEPTVVERVMKLAKVKKGDVFYDLGSGDGRLVIAAALKGAKAYGVEIDRLRVLYSQLWLKLLGLSNDTEIIREDFFKIDMSRADVVCLFLLQDTNQKLKSKLAKQLKPGTRIISYGFTLEDWQPEKIKIKDGQYDPIYLYITK